VSLPPKEVTNEFPSYLWRRWSWSEVIYAELEATHKDVEAMPSVFRGDELLQIAINRSYL